VVVVVSGSVVVVVVPGVVAVACFESVVSVQQSASHCVTVVIDACATPAKAATASGRRAKIMAVCVHVNTPRAELRVAMHVLHLPAMEGKSCVERGNVLH
jgi:hypothetical protein